MERDSCSFMNDDISGADLHISNGDLRWVIGRT